MPILAVNHHYFRAGGTGRGIYPTSPEMLRAEVARIRESGWEIGNQADLTAHLTGRPRAGRRLCILTFDDGLKEQIDAIRFLAELDACAICFVPTAPLVDRVVLDVHKLQMARSVMDDAALAKRLDARFGFGRHEFDDQLLEIQYRYDSQISRRVKYFLNFVLDEERRGPWVTELFASLFGDEAAAAEALYMDADDLRALARLGLLGSHGHAHAPLATLTIERMRDEFERSSEILSRLSGSKPVGVSYPYGGKSAVGAEVYGHAAKAGFVYGFTMQRGINDDAGDQNPLALLRIDTNDLEDWVAPAG